MKKEYVLLMMIVILCSCSANKINKSYRQIANNGYTGMIYEFTDSGNRNIHIAFTSDSTVEIYNRTNIAHNYHLLNFNSVYSYEVVEAGYLFISKMLSSDKILKKDRYLKPYSHVQYYLDSAAVELVFPNIDKETLMFSADLSRLQIREFSFDRVKK